MEAKSASFGLINQGSLLIFINSSKMGKSNAERSKLKRLKQKNDSEKYAEVLETDRRRKKVLQEKLKNTLTPVEAENLQQKRRDDQRKYRAKKKAAKEPSSTGNQENSPSGFTSTRSLNKAVSRAKQHLPKDSSRECSVLGELVKNLSPRKRQTVFSNVPEPKARRRLISEKSARSDAIPEQVLDDVRAFYQRDDISRMCPGKKDYISIKTDQGRERHQKRLLLMNISEAHSLFCQDFGEGVIGLSKFAEIRPKYVMTMTARSQDVCLCRYHENVGLIATSLHKHCTEIPSNPNDLVKMTLCDLMREECVDRKCDNCGVAPSLDIFLQDVDENLDTTYYQWVTSDGRTTKKAITEKLSDVKTKMYLQLETFSRHVYDTKRQHIELKHLKQEMKVGEIILHEDFSENCTLRHQDEIMTAHWSSDSATLFTAIVYYRPAVGEDVEHISYGVISDELTHDKKAVYSINKAILAAVSLKLPWEIEHVHYWSDGAASQFKNRFNFCNLMYHELDFKCTADWSFFATAHGKGAIDGIGGEVKRAVWRSVLQGKNVVSTSDQFFDVAQSLCRKITVLKVNQQQIKDDTAHLPERWETCQAVQGTQSLHFVRPAADGNIVVGRNSPFLHQQQLQQKTLLKRTQECAAATTTTTTTTSQEMRPINIGSYVMAKFMTGRGGKTEENICWTSTRLRPG